MVHQKNDESAVGGKTNKSRSVTDGRHDEGTDGHSEKTTAWVHRTCFEGGWSRERLSLGDDRGKKSERKTENKVHGWYQGDGGKREDRGSDGTDC